MVNVKNERCYRGYAVVLLCSAFITPNVRIAFPNEKESIKLSPILPIRPFLLSLCVITSKKPAHVRIRL